MSANSIAEPGSPAYLSAMNDVHRRSSLFKPQSDSEQSRRRHERNRRALYRARISGEPTSSQLQTIDTLVALEWAAYLCEREGGLHNLREAREHRRLLLRVLADFERTLVKPAAPQSARSLMDQYNLSRVASRQAP
jgi:hypothetical protein